MTRVRSADSPFPPETRGGAENRALRTVDALREGVGEDGTLRAQTEV